MVKDFYAKELIPDINAPLYMLKFSFVSFRINLQVLI